MEVSWPLDGTTVHGTVARPSGPGPFPAVVMVAGSGPTDRDWNSPLIPGSKGSARLIAEALAEAEIASLRYDKRASGPHAAENMPTLIGKMSMQSHVDELAGAVRTLADQSYVNSNRIFGLTNSEGALHALTIKLRQANWRWVWRCNVARAEDLPQEGMSTEFQATGTLRAISIPAALFSPVVYYY